MNHIPERIEKLFSLKQLKFAGIAMLLSLLALYVLSWVPQEPKTYSFEKEPLVSIYAQEVKYNTPAFQAFLKELKNRKQPLILGTSESVGLGGKNYTDYLNADEKLKKEFAVFGGAGRRVDVFMPLMLSNPELWKNQELIVFVNPIYWMDKLNKERGDYQFRYLHESFLYTMKSHSLAQEIEAYYAPDVLWKANQFLPFLSHIKNRTEALQQLTGNLSDTAFIYQTRTSAAKIDPTEDLKKGINRTYNISQYFYEHEKNLKLPEATEAKGFQFQIHDSFIQLCKELEIDLTMVIGPYNALLADALDQSDRKTNYEAAHEAFVQLLDANNTKTIDLWDLSYEPYVFIDYQHHSKYGAYKIYERMKTHYEKVD